MKNKKIKMVVSTLLVGILGMGLTACGHESIKENGSNVTISISGSTSVGPLMDKIAEKYEKSNDNISIEVQQTGSSAGIKDTINGVNEIGMASRELKESEASEVNGTVIAYDGIALIVNKANKVENITKEQIKDIYTGKINNWKELGGSNAPIVVVSREEGSGTRDAFQELIGYTSEDLTKDATICDGNGNVKSTVVSNENAIGFVSFEYLTDDINPLKVDEVEPNADNVKAKTYTLSRPFIITTKEGNVTEAGQAFINYILGQDGQQVVSENGLITLE